jgi:hypothetical protein
MSSLLDIQNAKSKYDASASTVTSNLQGYTDRINAVDPTAPDASSQIVAIKTEKDSYYAGARLDLKAKAQATYDTAGAFSGSAADRDAGQAIVNDTTSSIQHVAATRDAVDIATADALDRVDAVPAKPTEIGAELNNTPGVKDGPIPGVKVLTVQSDGLFEEGTSPDIPEDPTASLPDQAQISSEVNDALVGTTSRSALSVPKKSSGSAPRLLTIDFKMTLTSKQNPGDVVIFNVSPTIDESRSATYENMAPVHHPGTIQIYKSTQARSFNVSVKLISRTSAEASQNIEYINLIRSWVMPYYGQGTANSSMKDRLGAPPDILNFSVYGDRNISGVPVVLTSYHWVYPDNVDYIPTEDGVPFPTIIDVTLALIESYSPKEYTGFDITKYKSGDMVGAYTFSGTPSSGNTDPEIVG